MHHLPQTPCSSNNDPCTSVVYNTGQVVYSGPNLPCTGIDTCDNLTVALQKVDEKTCTLEEQIEILKDIVNSLTTTTTTTTQTPTTTTTTTIFCPSCTFYSVTNDNVTPIEFVYYECGGFLVNGSVSGPGTVYVCACTDTVVVPPVPGVTLQNLGACPVEPTTTTTTTTTLSPDVVIVVTSIEEAESFIAGPANDVASWNFAFSLPAFGTPFTSVNIVGTTITLSGATNINLRVSSFIGGDFIVSFDGGSVIKTTEANVFNLCTNLTSISLPAVTSVGNSAFADATSLTSINLPACTALGATTGDNGVFNNISGNTITFTLNSAIQTDGDVTYLQANNTVTLIVV